MDQGRIVEQGPPAQVIDHPAHERTRAFLQRVRTGADAPADSEPVGPAQPAASRSDSPEDLS
jgi:polar amino acid transport system ATP-binding protein